METADLIVIGSGQGGIPFAADFAKARHKVVLSRRDRSGRLCVTPTLQLLNFPEVFTGGDCAQHHGQFTARSQKSPRLLQRVGDIAAAIVVMSSGLLLWRAAQPNQFEQTLRST